MDKKTLYDTLIIGSGPAGLTAAIYNIRAELKTAVLAGPQPGGQLTITTIVENFPGFPKGIGGTKLMMDTMDQVKNLGGEIVNNLVAKVEKEGDVFKVTLDNGEVMETKAVIVGTGAQARWLGLPNEREFIGKGVSGCATCDGFFFRGKRVAVVGGGDVACEDAEFLAKMTDKVYLIHRRDQLRAQVPQQKLVLENPHIEMRWNSEVKEVIGENQFKGVKLLNNKSGEEMMMELDGLFVAIGRDPATSFVKGIVEMKESGHIITGKSTEYMTMTSMEGIFAAGDCVDDNYRQAIVAAGDGCRAGLDAERWIARSRNK